MKGIFSGSASPFPSPVYRRFFVLFHSFSNFSPAKPGPGLKIPDSLSKKISRNPDWGHLTVCTKKFDIFLNIGVRHWE